MSPQQQILQEFPGATFSFTYPSIVVFLPYTWAENNPHKIKSGVPVYYAEMHSDNTDASLLQVLDMARSDKQYYLPLEIR